VSYAPREKEGPLACCCRGFPSLGSSRSRRSRKEEEDLGGFSSNWLCLPHPRSLCESRNFRLKPVSRFFVGVEYINAAGYSARKRAVGGVWGGEVGGVA